MTPVCAVDGCTTPVRARLLCGAHWQRWRRHGDPAVTAKSTPGPRTPSGLPDWLDLERLAGTDPRPGWWRDAACTGLGTGLFFPPAASRVHHETRRVCAGCPVRYDCLADVLAWESGARRYGHWAATNRPQRQLIAAALRQERDLHQNGAA